MSHQNVRQTVRWGTYGKGGRYPLCWITIKDLSDAHIQAILRTQYHIERWLRDTFHEELIWRKMRGILVPDCDTYKISHNKPLPF